MTMISMMLLVNLVAAVPGPIQFYKDQLNTCNVNLFNTEMWYKAAQSQVNTCLSTLTQVMPNASKDAPCQSVLTIFQGNINNLNTKYQNCIKSKLSPDVLALQNSLDLANAQISNLQLYYTGIQDKQQAAETENIALKAKVASLESLLSQTSTQLLAENEQLRNSLSARDSQIATLNNQIQTASQQVDQRTQQLQNLPKI